MFYLASANYKIGEFKTALNHINDLLSIEPTNSQAIDMKKKIEKKVTNGKAQILF
jgi:hypothetical protein